MKQEQEQQAMYLVFAEGYSLRKAASETGISLSTLTRCVHEAKEKFNTPQPWQHDSIEVSDDPKFMSTLAELDDGLTSEVRSISKYLNDLGSQVEFKHAGCLIVAVTEQGKIGCSTRQYYTCLLYTSPSPRD